MEILKCPCSRDRKLTKVCMTLHTNVIISKNWSQTSNASSTFFFFTTTSRDQEPLTEKRSPIKSRWRVDIAWHGLLNNGSRVIPNHKAWRVECCNGTRDERKEEGGSPFNREHLELSVHSRKRQAAVWGNESCHIFYPAARSLQSGRACAAVIVLIYLFMGEDRGDWHMALASFFFFSFFPLFFIESIWNAFITICSDRA